MSRGLLGKEREAVFQGGRGVYGQVLKQEGASPDWNRKDRQGGER